MSSFSALNGAFTSLTAHRIALEVTSQNISNVNTRGYTRQRVDLQAITAGAQSSMHSTAPARHTGVQATSIDRLGDVFLENKLRTQTSSAARLDAAAAAWVQLETTVDEPSENGLAAGLDTFFTSWQDVANRPDDDAAKSVLLGNAEGLIADIARGYRATENQWDTTRARADALVQDVNTTASAVADLNDRIRDALVAGSSPNELVDQRAVLLEGLAAMVGGEVRERPDGSADVMIGGNALVRGGTASPLAVHGSGSYADLAAAGPEPADGWTSRSGPTRLVWASSGHTAGATGGRLAGTLDALAPASQGGPLASMAETYNALATTVAGEVNALHSSLAGADGEHRNFFSFGDGPAALSMGLAVGVDDLVTGVAGEVDGSVAAGIAELSGARDLWSSAVVELGVSTRTATRRAEAAETTRASAEGQLLSQTAVDLDEETVNLVMYQRAYEAAARVLTTVDEMLDTLINRTGVVGR